MKLKFSLDAVKSREFGVGKENGKSQQFTAIPVDADIQMALVEMVVRTWDCLREQTHDPQQYDPSEKHASVEYLYLPVTEDIAAAMSLLHDAVNLPLNANALKNPSDVFCYFARMTDKQGRRLTALRRATQFKGSLKSRFVKLQTDALKMVPDELFKLDRDFDLLIDADNIHILRPSGFEFAGKLQAAIMATVPANVAIVQKELPFVDFIGIEAYATQHPRAARYLASIRSQEQCKDVDKRALKKLCDATGVIYSEKSGKLQVQESQIIDFLEVIDRRRYLLELVPGKPERFKAASRQRLAG